MSRACIVNVLFAAACGAVNPNEPPAKLGPDKPPTALPVRNTTLAPPGSAADSKTQQEPLNSVGAIGTEHSVVVQATAADGRWVAFCQAREDSDGDGNVRVRLGPHGALEGDRLKAFVAFGAGEGEPIDELLAHDAEGKWLVIRRGASAELFDAKGSSHADLSARGADIRRDSLPQRTHRALDFDAEGKRLLYVRGGSHPKLVVLELETQKETVIDVGGGTIWRAEFDPTGEHIVLQVLIGDTNGNGRLDWPAPESNANNRCSERTPVSGFDAWPSQGDRPTVKVVSSQGGTVRQVDGFVALLGSSAIVREANGRLLLQNGTSRQEISSAKCAGRLYHADAFRQRLLYACAGNNPLVRSPLVLWSSDKKLELSLGIVPAGRDRWPVESSRLVAVYPGRDVGLVDMQTERALALRSGDGVVAVSESRALLRRGNTLVLFDADTGAETLLPGRTDRIFDTVVRSKIAVVSPLVVDLAKRSVLGQVKQRPLAVAADGRVLIADRGEPSAQALAMGPLEWRRPDPLP